MSLSPSTTVRSPGRGVEMNRRVMRESRRDLRTRKRRRLFGLCLCCVPVLAPGASAQPLDLDGTGPPGIGTPNTMTAMIDRQRARLEQLARETEDVPPSPSLRAERVLRELVIRLLDAESFAHPERVLAASTIARAGLPDAVRALEPPGEWISENPPSPREIDGVLLFLVGDLGRIDPATLEDPSALDRALRDALAHLADHLAAADDLDAPAGPTGWIDRPNAPPPASAAELEAAIERWTAAEPPLNERTSEALAALAHRLEIAEGYLSYQGASGRQRRLILDAGGVLDLNARALDAASQRGLALAFSRAIVTLADTDASASDRRHAANELRSLADIARVLLGTRRLADRAAARAIPARLLAAMESRSLTELSLTPTLAALDLALRTQSLPDERTIARPLRPAYRTVVEHAERSGRMVAGAIPDLINDPGRLSGLTAMSAARERLGRLDRIATLSGVIAESPGSGREPRVRERFERLARTALAIGQRLASDPGDQAALRSLDLLLEGARSMRPTDAERSFRESTPGADSRGSSHTGLDGQPDAVFDALDAARDRWVRVWSDADEADQRAEVTRSLLALTRLARTLDDVRWSGRASAPARAAIDAWAGFELSRSARQQLARPASEEIARLMPATAGASGNQLNRALEEFNDRHAAARLLGSLERRARELGLRPPSSPLEAVYELGQGPPNDETSWLAGARLDLARFCLYAEELARLRDEGRTTWADHLRRYVNRLAARILDRLGPGS